MQVSLNKWALQRGSRTWCRRCGTVLPERRHAAEVLPNATRHCSNQQRAFLHTLVGPFGEGGERLEFYIAHAAPPKEAGYTARLEHGRDLKTALGGPPGPISRPLTTQTLKNSYFFIGRIGSPRTIADLYHRISPLSPCQRRVAHDLSQLWPCCQSRLARARPVPALVFARAMQVPCPRPHLRSQ